MPPYRTSMALHSGLGPHSCLLYVCSCCRGGNASSQLVLIATHALADTLTLLAERWLRHLRRIPGALRRRDKWLDIAACIFGILGSCALIILASANDRTYPTVHW